MNGRLSAASLVSAVVILSAPFMGQLRGSLRSTFPGHFVAIVGGCIALAVAAVVLTALARIRERRVARYGAMALALGLGVGYSVVSSVGFPEVDAVERVHFIEYGLLTFLFYRVWRPNGDLSVFILPVLAGVSVGTFDEWLQWFIPVRVGEARDVLLNLVAISCALLFGVAIDPPRPFAPRLGSASRRVVGLTAAVVLLVFAAFVNAVHVGQVVTDDRIGAFKSHYSMAELEALKRDRTERWRANPPIALKRLSREDQYMDEGLWHVRRRNESWTAGDYATAWKENQILEGFFTPVLDTPSYAAPEGNRWPAAQRADAGERAGSAPAAFVSSAEPYPIVTWPKAFFWTVVLAAATGIAGGSILLGRAQNSRAAEVAART